MKKVCLLMCIVLLLTGTVCAENTGDISQKTIIISEIMASNSACIIDAYGKYSDWIELYNCTSTDFDLSGYHLSDEKKNLTQYTFPDGVVLPTKVIWLFGAQEKPRI